MPIVFNKGRTWQKKGAALVTVILLTLLLLVFAGSLIQLAVVDKKAAANQVAMIQALYLAEAGVEIMLARLAVDFYNATLPPDKSFPLENGKYGKYSIEKISEKNTTTKEIISEGQVFNQEGKLLARKKLKVQVQRTAGPVLQNAVCSGSSLTLSGSVSIIGNLLVNGDLNVNSGVSISGAGRLVVGDKLTNKSGTNKNEGINISPGGSLLVGRNLDNKHGRIEAPAYLQVDGTIDNAGGIIIFSSYGAYYTPSTEYPAGTFTIQNDGRVPRLDGPRENIADLVEPAARLDPAGKVAAYQGYPRLPVTRKGNECEFNFTGTTADIYYLDITTLEDGEDGDKNKGRQSNKVQKIQLSGTYTGKWLIAVKGNVEISGDLQPANASRDVLVLLVDGTVSVQGNKNISAVIYASRFEAGGNSTIKGTVVAQSFDIGGTVDIIQDDNLVQSAVPVLQCKGPGLQQGGLEELLTIKVISWQEEPDVF